MDDATATGRGVTLIASPRHTPADLRHWAALEEADRLRARLPRMARMVARARDAIREFVVAHPDAYVGVSWGKDSVVVSYLALRLFPGLRLRRMVSTIRTEQPGTSDVRDAFLATRPDVDYAEFEARGQREALAAMDRWLEHAPRITGVRADESADRRLSARVHGVATDRSCRPLLDWSGDDVFAYLHREGLPVHPVYAMTVGGGLDRRHLRVHNIGGKRGEEFGRRQWEDHYFPEFRVRQMS